MGSTQSDPEMHQTKKGNQYYFSVKAHIGVDDESGVVRSVVALIRYQNETVARRGFEKKAS